MPFLGLLGELARKKPEVPEFKPVDPGAEVATATSSNRSNFAGIKDLAKETNQFNQEELMKAIRGVVPDADKILNKASGNIYSLLKGEIPEDVQSQIGRTTAAKSFSGGYGGSGAARNLTLRDLGMNSFQATQQGLSNAAMWLQNARATTVAPQFDVTSMFISPQMQIANTWQNRQAEFNRNFMKNQIDAEHAFGTKFANAMQQADAFIQQLALSYGGMLAGGMGGGGGAAMAGGARPQNWGSMSPAEQGHYTGYRNYVQQFVPPGSTWE